MSAPSEPSSADGLVENGRDTDASPYPDPSVAFADLYTEPIGARA